MNTQTTAGKMTPSAASRGIFEPICKYGVEVHFATSALPRIVAVFALKEDAEREARAYMSDAKSVRIVEVPRQ
jgi:hypothetical protein